VIVQKDPCRSETAPLDYQGATFYSAERRFVLRVGQV
jgi:hypothetical protein